ncbi:hypothetical protein NF212_18415 [Parasalinivibrio latis]|uniref:hypothetical protein n=1 Tax=Parasalinivibrio latis TaxID=2952610 RepID=UPI0030E36059
MTNSTYSRRTILKMGMLTATAAYAYAVAGISLSGKTWALTVNTLDSDTANGLLQVCRSIYPHPKLDDLFYAASVESIDAQAAQNPELNAAITKGIAALQASAGGAWDKASSQKQVALLQGVESDAFFQAIRGNMVVSFYDNPAIWSEFGYEGPSFEKGGYINRGFDDIEWLPVSDKG